VGSKAGGEDPAPGEKEQRQFGDFGSIYAEEEISDESMSRPGN
jgi:hypothetical protein